MDGLVVIVPFEGVEALDFRHVELRIKIVYTKF
jgi:hypothetical protein